jgi:hypothetical protein
MLAPLCYLTAACTTLMFPNVALDLGIRHIHTPEHFAVAHGLTLPGFELVDSTPPVRVKDYALVSFRFRTLFSAEVRSARMFTNDRCTSHLLFQDHADRATMLATFSVKGVGMSGHSLHLSGTPLGELAPLERLLGAVTVTRDGVLQAILTGYGVMGDEDENLRLYRRMVLFGVDV